MREVVGQAMRSRRYLVMTGAYFVCGLQLIFLTTHLPNYLAICGQDPMLKRNRSGHHRRREHLRVLERRLVRRPVSQIHPAGLAVSLPSIVLGIFFMIRRRQPQRSFSPPRWPCYGWA